MSKDFSIFAPKKCKKHMIDFHSIVATVLASAEIAEKAWEHSNEIVRLFNKMKKPIRVLILGESGSGKSQFISTLQNKREFSRERTQVSSVYPFSLPNGRRIELVDVPGHKTLTSERTEQIGEMMKGNFDGLINVVCYGYQSSSDMDKSNVFQGGEVREDYLKENRLREIHQLNEWLPFINKNCDLKWVLTVVNKADVWWEKDVEVKNYYEFDTYNNNLRSIERVAKVLTLPYCSVITPFYDEPMKITFGEKDKMALHLYLCEHLSKLTGEKWQG